MQKRVQVPYELRAVVKGYLILCVCTTAHREPVCKQASGWMLPVFSKAALLAHILHGNVCNFEHSLATQNPRIPGRAGSERKRRAKSGVNTPRGRRFTQLRFAGGSTGFRWAQEQRNSRLAKIRCVSLAGKKGGSP